MSRSRWRSGSIILPNSGGLFAGAGSPCAPRYAGAPLEHGLAMLGTRVTFPSRGKSPKARQGLRPLESPGVSAKLWEPDAVRFEGWNANPIGIEAITIPYRPFRARCASRRATFCHKKLRPICHFGFVSKSVLFFLWFPRENTLYFQSVARQDCLRGCLRV